MTSATGEPRGFTLIEVLLALALVGLLGWIFVGASAALLNDQGASPDEQFWKACGAARQEALAEQRTVLLSFDGKTRAFVLSDGAGQRSLPFTAPPDTVLDFHPVAAAGSASAVLIGGTLVETTPMTHAAFYSDGTCTAFRAQVRTAAGAHMLAVDPWTCAPMISDATS